MYYFPSIIFKYFENRGCPKGYPKPPRFYPQNKPFSELDEGCPKGVPWGRFEMTSPFRILSSGCGSRQATLTMVYKLGREAEKRWRRLDGSRLIVKVLHGVEFLDGEEQTDDRRAA